MLVGGGGLISALNPKPLHSPSRMGGLNVRGIAGLPPKLDSDH